jgi:hypothetical protein
VAGEHCNPSTAGLLIAAANGAIGKADGLLAAFGINVVKVQ